MNKNKQRRQRAARARLEAAIAGPHEFKNSDGAQKAQTCLVNLEKKGVRCGG